MSQKREKTCIEFGKRRPKIRSISGKKVDGKLAKKSEKDESITKVFKNNGNKRKKKSK